MTQDCHNIPTSGTIRIPKKPPYGLAARYALNRDWILLRKFTLLNHNFTRLIRRFMGIDIP